MNPHGVCCICGVPLDREEMPACAPCARDASEEIKSARAPREFDAGCEVDEDEPEETEGAMYRREARI